ncbi:MAG: peptidylprolyl isomerase [Rhodospirillaceae bacterium]|jgi:rhodanese-related sulfurtransferase|nr:peptidylprolyl isomerase [Rhodospirillaceae bacterium]MBT4590017.1 peptidylprolyl isomerase [Rhodospirillaceae bacterium]MBT5941382.1 peptidylprolyl isomerase [Rhodospirillaceae bacterium]MBT7268032.1 peptidylprolyl isomerase [Rhodospirillaceae bacterium]
MLRKIILGVSFLMAGILFTPGLSWSSHGAADIDTKVLAKGNGAKAVRHSKVLVHYTGWLKNGTKFDSSVDRGKPFEFTLGAGQVIPGWDQGVEGMKVGGKRELVIPPELAYGKKGAGGVIPPNATLKFEIALLSVTPPKYSNIDNASLQKLLATGTKIIDLRRQDEWDKTGVVAGSRKLTAFDSMGNFIRSFPAEFQKIANKNEPVILICRTGNRSSVLANMLVEQAGYSKVYNVTDGIEKWIKGGNPIVR